MFTKETLDKFAALYNGKDKVTVDCYDPDCPFGLDMGCGELPVEIKHSEDGDSLIATCLAYDYSFPGCDVPDMVLADLEMEVDNI